MPLPEPIAVLPPLLLLFFVSLVLLLLQTKRLFTPRYGRRHRIAGLVLLLWQLIGLCTIWEPVSPVGAIAYDVGLGILGIMATLSAACDFRRAHETVANTASGTLEPEATVTFSEMVEHAFYQILNLVQALVLHAMEVVQSLSARAALLFALTAPWLVRDRFPVNRFSDNYTKGQDPLALLPLLYRVKKYQYLLYKHALLHGLNVSVALSPSLRLVCTPTWRLYWLCINTAYVMEFFMQTLVKRGHIHQQSMLALQAILMLVSSGAALCVLRDVYLIAAGLSLFLNLVHRHHEVMNAAIVYACTLAWIRLFSDQGRFGLRWDAPAYQGR